MGRYSKEIRERGVRLRIEAIDKHDSRRAAVDSIAKKLGCAAQTFNKQVKQAERHEGKRPGLTTEERSRLRELGRKNKELKRANTILRQASAVFAQAELDRGRK